MTKHDAIVEVNSKTFRSISNIHQKLPKLNISKNPIDVNYIGHDIYIYTYECQCDDGIINIKGALYTPNWNEYTVGYVFAE